MSDPREIICKPTPWFTMRAAIMLAMFGVFSVLFYLDGSTGYRKKNEAFYLKRAFQSASQDFSRLNSSGALTPASWEAFAAKRHVELPQDRSVMPAGTPSDLPWPSPLRDFERMKSLQWESLWNEYSREAGLTANPPEEPYDARKIQEQWVVFWFCLALSSLALFLLVRTLRRRIAANQEGITTQEGKFVPYGELKTLDLRKWDTKGLAFIHYDGPSGKGRIRVDGLTYGGFKKEDGEPAEMLMQLIRRHFSGEILEYAVAESPARTSSGESDLS